jgi:hypothetical protein
VSPTVTDKEPLHLRVRLLLLVDVVTIFSPRTYNGFRLDFSASEPASLAVVEFLAAYSPSTLLWSSETVRSTAFRVSKESHSGLALHPLRTIGKRKPKTTMVARENASSASDMPWRNWESSVSNRFEEALFRVAGAAGVPCPWWNVADYAPRFADLLEFLA